MLSLKTLGIRSGHLGGENGSIRGLLCGKFQSGIDFREAILHCNTSLNSVKDTQRHSGDPIQLAL
jgi:hypothetical protein